MSSLFKRSMRFVWVLLSLVTAAFASEKPVQSNDIPKIVNHILSYHIEHKKITPLLIGRSFKVFFEQADPNKNYLLASEVQPYYQPSAEVISSARLAFERGELSVYDKLNDSIRKGILRQRVWRKEFRKNSQLFMANKEEVYSKSATYAKNEAELKERIFNQLGRFVKWHQKDETFTVFQVEKALELFERQIQNHENSFLCHEMKGRDIENALTTKVIKSFIASLDSHSSYYTTNEAYMLKVQLEKELCGIGVVFQESIEGIRISRLINGGPADKSGQIQEDDLLVEVNGLSTTEMPFDQAVNLLRGDENSLVSLGLVRKKSDSQENKINVQLKRAKIVMQEERLEVDYDVVEGGVIGKIALHSFYEGNKSSEKDLKDALESLYKMGDIKGLVLDLRYNTGGFLTQAIKVTGLFITNGVVAMAKYSDGSVHYFRDLDGYVYYDGPLVVLTSRGSASASEIVAQSLQDYGVALVVGDARTYGKGTIQYQNVTDDRTGAYFKVTVGRYYSVSGKSIQLEGVKSDIVVPTAFYDMDIGEKFTDYPLTSDHMLPAFTDPLTDVDPIAYPWFKQYYLPTVQKRQSQWRDMIPELAKNSQERLANNKEYQEFLEERSALSVKSSKSMAREDKDLATDHVMEEACEIIKEMIHIQKTQSITADVVLAK